MYLYDKAPLLSVLMRQLNKGMHDDVLSGTRAQQRERADGNTCVPSTPLVLIVPHIFS